MALLRDAYLKAPKFSNFDLSRRVCFTAAPGPLYPILTEELLPGDRVKIRIPNLDVKTYPLQSPYYGTFKQQIAFFFVPTRLYVQAMDINRLGSVAQPQNVVFPTFTEQNSTASSGVGLSSFGNTSSLFIKKSSILDFLGFGAGRFASLNGNTDGVNNFNSYNAVPLIGYYDIFRNYYSNVQETNAYIVAPNVGSASSISPIPLSDFDTFVDQFVKGETSFLTAWSNLSTSIRSPHLLSYIGNLGGLMFRTHNPDMLNAWLSQGTYDTMVTSTSISTTGDSFSINQFRMASHGMSYYERGLIGGSRYDDFVYAQYGVRTDNKLCIPELLGVVSSDIGFDEVVSTAASGTGLGDLGGRGQGSLTSRVFRFTSTEHGYLMAIYSLVPNMYYSARNQPWILKKNLSAVFAPAFDNIGFQPLLTGFASNLFPATISGSASYSNTESVLGRNALLDTTGFSYQPAWIEYTTALNQVHGDFNPYVGDLYYWTPTRLFTKFFDFSVESEVSGIGFQPMRYPDIASAGTDFTVGVQTTYTSYVLPGQFMTPFVNQAETAENFLVQCPFDFMVSRCKSKNPMPTLA